MSNRWVIPAGLNLQDDDEDLKEGEKPRWQRQQEKWEKLRSDRIEAEEDLKEFWRPAIAKR